MRKTAIVLIALLLSATPAFAKVKVVATLPWIGSVADEIGKEQVEVTTLVKPNQDPHLVEARPSMILATRKADILMYNGLDLEIGYLPVLIESSRNPEHPARQAGQFRRLPFRHGPGEAGLGRPEHGRRPPAGQPPLPLFRSKHPRRRGRDGRRPVHDRSVPCRCLQGQPGGVPGKGPGEAEGVERPADERETVRRLSQALRVSGRRLRIHDHGIRRTQAGYPALRRLHRTVDRDDQGIPARRHPDHAHLRPQGGGFPRTENGRPQASSFPTTWGRRRAPKIGSPSWTRRFRRS